MSFEVCSLYIILLILTILLYQHGVIYRDSAGSININLVLT